MQPSLITLMEAAELIGRPGNRGRTWLKRYIHQRQEEAERVIIHDGKTQHVNVDDLRQLCPELFPVEYNRAAAELRAEIERNRRAESELREQFEQLAEATYALYVDLSERSDHQRSPAITPSAMDEESKVSLSPKSETTNLNELAHHGSTPPEKTHYAVQDNASRQ